MGKKPTRKQYVALAVMAIGHLNFQKGETITTEQVNADTLAELEKNGQVEYTGEFEFDGSDWHAKDKVAKEVEATAPPAEDATKDKVAKEVEATAPPAEDATEPPPAPQHAPAEPDKAEPKKGGK